MTIHKLKDIYLDAKRKTTFTEHMKLNYYLPNSQNRTVGYHFIDKETDAQKGLTKG